ncbi:diguanylate cyclase [Solidesulfovibrio alcoholivorans]|uniref:diguanylate cyclase n=1 Tax=Solidesulfovibrio alcoholivorans TaxID=81406 RepID=UPI00049597FE|nr:diguanylate cyclase [Solidesulfovibrio alcoholivorans]
MLENLDIRTLAVCYGIFCCTQFVAFFLQHKISKQGEGLGWWTLGSGCTVFGFFLFFLRDIPTFHSFIVFIYNFTFILCFSFIYIGCAKYNDSKILKKYLYITLSLAAFCLLYFTYVNSSIPLRRTITSFACAIFSIFSATTLRQNSPNERNIVIDFLKVIFIVDAFWLSAFAVIPLLTASVPLLFEKPSPLILSYLLLITTSTLWTFGLIILVNQKLSSQLQTSKLFLQSTLDGLSASIALIEEHGEIILTNKAWRDFASANGVAPERVSEGVNYLTTCESNATSCCSDAFLFSEGLKSVLSGARSLFTMEYPCHSPGKRRWFLARVTRFPCQGPTRAVIAHEDITERKLMEIALEESNKQLEAITNEDGLTKISNRRHFDKMLSYECSRHSRSGTTLSIAMLDIDYFKYYNDTYGHVKGDECLQRVARAIARSLNRPTDLAARYGGEEFVCLMPDTNLLGAVGVAENIRKTIANLAIPHAGSEVSDTVTVSIGTLSLTCTKDTTPDSIIRKTDELLYQAKHEGRNRIKFASIDETYRLDQANGGIGTLKILFSDTYTSGNSTIDTQHAQLISLANDLLQHTFTNNTPQETQRLLVDIFVHVKKHFEDEEAILHANNYPEIDNHAAEHARLVRQYSKLIQTDTSKDIQTIDILQYIIHDIIMEHMIKEDSKYHYIFNDIH